MDILLNPNIAYLILAFGLMITILAILSPGTGLLEVGAVLVLGLVAWEVYNLSFNWWALITLVLGMVFFVLAVRRPKQPVFLIISIIALIIGSAFLFPSDEWWKPAVNPVLALVVSLLLTGFFWVVTHKILEARNAPPRLDLNLVVGESGEAKTDIQDEGAVLIGSELWSARSSDRIPRGARVRVIGRDGFILNVVPANDSNQQEVKT
jgi:membrane-bound serine protease (ClpP class)